MAGFLMQALENYSAEIAAEIDANTIGPGYFLPEQVYISLAYDRVGRNIVYPVVITYGSDPRNATNDTGFTLWDGLTSLAPAATYDNLTNKNLFVGVKDIDTGVVDFFDTWSATELVPAGIGGGDGTWRRYVSDTKIVDNIPALTDPRNQNVWIHVQSCNLHMLRRSQDYAQSISPFRPVEDQDNPCVPFGMSDAWVYVSEVQTTEDIALYLIPRVLTAEEISADVLLAYATFVFPFTITSAWFRTCVISSGSFFILSSNTDAEVTFDFTLRLFTPPTSAPYGGPTVGGGFTDVTPWTSITGPNAAAQAYEPALLSKTNGLVLFNIPSSQTLVCVTALLASEIISGDPSDPNNTQFGCTYINTASYAFTQHDAFVTGYMTSGWATTGSVDEAAYVVLRIREIDQDIQAHSYTFPTFDYSLRWFRFDCQFVTNGVVDDAHDRVVLVQYRFAAGVDPVVVRVVSEQPWDDIYTDYADTIGEPAVVFASLSFVDQWSYPSNTRINDGGIWDQQTNAMWFSGRNENFWQFDDAFTPREGQLGPTGEPKYYQPLMRLGFGDRRRAYADMARVQSNLVTVQGSPPTNLPTGVYYAGFQVVALGGDGGPYTYSDAGTLPPGMTINATSGLAAGTPTTDGDYEVTIFATDGMGRVGALAPFTVTIGIALAPVNLTAPVVSGVAVEGETLTVTNGTWDNAPVSFARQWRQDGIAITGETGASYLLLPGDIGSLIDCVVTATNATGSTPATSNSKGPIAASSAPVNLTAPVVTGSTVVGGTLTTTDGTWSGAPTSYARKWQKNTLDIPGETNATYDPVVGDVGALIRSVVTATNVGGSTPKNSNTVGPITAALSKLAPSAQWDGTAGTGFGGAYAPVPTNPARTTAKPWCLPLFQNWMTVTGDVVIGFEAGNYLDGDAWDLDSLTFTLEGNEIITLAPEEITYTDANLLTKSLFGYFCTLDYATWIALSSSGTAYLYATAVPSDPTMQNRVMGPYTFYARTTEFTDTVTVGASGKTYTNIKDALTFCRLNPTKRVNIVLSDDGASYPIAGQAVSFVSAKWWTVISAAPGVTATLGDGSTVFTQPGYDGIELRGSGVVFNVASLGYGMNTAWRFSNGGQARLCVNGATVVGGTPSVLHGGSGTGSAALVNGKQPSSYFINGNDPYASWNIFFLDVVATGLAGYGLSFYKLRRNCEVTDVSGSDAEIGECLSGGFSDKIGGYYSGLRTEQGAFDMTGPVGSAYECTGGNGGARVFKVYTLFADASPAHTFSISDVTPVSSVITAINGWAGWAATSTPSTNELSAAYLSRADLAPSVAIPKTALSGTAHITRIADIHADVPVWHASGSPLIIPNVAVRRFEVRRNVGTAFMSVPDGDVTSQDWGICNVSCQDISVSLGESSQPAVWTGPHSHVVVQYMSNTNPSGFAMSGSYDGYCAFDHTAGRLAWSGSPDADLNLTSNACPSLPSGSDANSKVVSTNQALLYTAPTANPPNFDPLAPLHLTDLSYAGRYLPGGGEQGS